MGKYLADSYDAALRENADLKTRLADKEILLAEAVEYGTGYKQAYDEAMANYQMALARLAEAEDTIERAGRCLVMSNNGAVEALTILRGYKQPDSAPAAHVHTDDCWEPDSGCDMGRNERFAASVPSSASDALQKFASDLADAQRPLDPEVARVLYENKESLYMTDADQPPAAMSAEEHCRLFCAWKGGGPCLADDCPRRNVDQPEAAGK